MLTNKETQYLQTIWSLQVANDNGLVLTQMRLILQSCINQSIYLQGKSVEWFLFRCNMGLLWFKTMCECLKYQCHIKSGKQDHTKRSIRNNETLNKLSKFNGRNINHLRKNVIKLRKQIFETSKCILHRQNGDTKIS